MSFDPEKFLKPIPLPQKGDVLFQPADDWWHNACIDQWGDCSEAYINGYKSAADALITTVLSNERPIIDHLVYPIVFLYRHYLELRLKELNQEASKLLGKPWRANPIHDLNRLWVSVRPDLEEIWPNACRDELDAISDLIGQFCQVDPSSTAFRYPLNKNGSKSINNLSHINLRHLKDNIDKISIILDGSSCGIAEYMKNMSHEYEY